jgi:hypothetical protein
MTGNIVVTGVVAVRCGAGIQNKVLEAIAYGIPVIASPPDGCRAACQSWSGSAGRGHS